MAKVNNQHTLRCGEYLVAVRLCSRGQAFYDEWGRLVKELATPEEIYQTMQDYFYHRNGIRTRNGQMAIAGCCQCCVVVIDSIAKTRNQ